MTPVTPSSDNDLKVITYNLHKGRGRWRASILHDAVDALRERQPDILLCQEVFAGAGQALHQCAFITEELGHDHAFGPNAFYRRGCHGNATFANLPVERALNIDVTHARLEKRGILRTWLRGPPGPIEVFNVHFSLTHRQRWLQWERLLAELPDDPTVPVIIGGDFNDWPGRLDRRARSSPLRNALWQLPEPDRRSYPAHRPRFPLDRIYVRGLAIANVRVLTGLPWSRLSDHLPVEAELRFD